MQIAILPYYHITTNSVFRNPNWIVLWTLRIFKGPLFCIESGPKLLTNHEKSFITCTQPPNMFQTYTNHNSAHRDLCSYVKLRSISYCKFFLLLSFFLMFLSFSFVWQKGEGTEVSAKDEAGSNLGSYNYTALGK